MVNKTTSKRTQPSPCIDSPASFDWNRFHDVDAGVMNLRFNILVMMMAFLVPLSGCLQSTFGCGDAYNEMHMGDYVFQTLEVDSVTGVLTVVVSSDTSMGYVQNDDWENERYPAYATLTVKMSDGSTSDAGPRIQNDWTVTADSGDYWSTTLTFESAAGFCDDGCDRVKLDASAYTDPYNSVLYHDGTCRSSPWIDID